jgi:hypothetical protein
MFSKLPDLWGVASETGFTVIRRGNPLTEFAVEYSEGDRVLRYTLENLVAGSVQPIESRLIGPWLSPHDGEDLAPAEQVKIAGRIAAGMNYLGDKFAVV